MYNLSNRLFTSDRRASACREPKFLCRKHIKTYKNLYKNIYVKCWVWSWAATTELLHARATTTTCHAVWTLISFFRFDGACPQAPAVDVLPKLVGRSGSTGGLRQWPTSRHQTGSGGLRAVTATGSAEENFSMTQKSGKKTAGTLHTDRPVLQKHRLQPQLKGTTFSVTPDHSYASASSLENADLWKSYETIIKQTIQTYTAPIKTYFCERQAR